MQLTFRMYVVICGLAAVMNASAAEVSRWQFDGTALDQVGSRHGTLLGNASYSTDVPPGATGMSLQLDGSLDKMIYDVAVGDVLDGSFTVAAWVRPAESRANGTLSWFGTRYPADGSFDFKARLADNTAIRLDIGNGSTFPVISDTAVNLGVDSWRHVAVVVQPTQYDLYVDFMPARQFSYAAFTPMLWDADHDIAVGAISAETMPNGPPDGEDFAGLIDDVRVFDTALTPDEISALQIPEPMAMQLLALGVAMGRGVRRLRAR